LPRQKAASKANPLVRKSAPTKGCACYCANSANDTKKLKVDVAIGKSKLKKLQSNLLEAQGVKHLKK